MTENEAIQYDNNADAQARISLCSAGPVECDGRNAKRDDSAPVFRRAAVSFRVYDGATPTGRRLYVCRYCRTPRIIPT